VLKNFILSKKAFSRLVFGFTAIVLALMWALPFMVPQASALGQITARKVAISTAQPGVAATYTFNFTTATSGFHLDGIKIIACTTAVGTYPGGSCSAPSGFSWVGASYSNGSQSGFTDSTNFTIDTSGANDCVATSHPEVLCLKRTSSSNDTAGAKQLALTSVTNASTANSSYYLGITTYNTNTWTVGGRQDAGTVATAVVQTLTVAATVPESLNFCIGATSVDDTTTDPTNSGGHDCSVISGTSVSLGTLDPTLICITGPSNSCNGGSNTNGIAMLRTNATSGATISYDAIQQAGTNHKGTLRVSSATCNAGSVNTDQCIDAQGATQGAFTAGTEDYGMTIAGVNKGSTSSYSCSYTANPNTCHLEPSTNYLGQGTAGSSEAYGTGNGFAWVETSGTVTQIASSTLPVDDEALILKFAATPAIVTPPGSYTAQADYIAVPTF
jgi:hypothetical protein